jgi:hypothetical protein
VFLVYLMAGIPYDLLHAVGNVAFVAWLANSLSDIMTRHVAIPTAMVVNDVATNRV